MKHADILNEIKMRLDIIDVISEYVNLKRAGANFKGLCPFHQEKTPSFTVSPSKQFYYCFGCGESGDIVTFVKKIENLSFHEAIERLAKKAGIEYRYGDTGNRSRQSFMLSILKEAEVFFRDNLQKDKDAMDYLKLKRGLTEESINKFALGFAPKAWDSLMDYLKTRGFTETNMKEVGLISYSEKGSYDLFRNRIIFPIHNLQGEVIGFGGRVMDDTLPKYINSPETALFKKGENLYGLFQAREDIKREGYAIITEGYLDVIMCHQNGFTNVIAPLGTALTERQVVILKRLTERILLLYDGDSAGITAAKRAIPILLGQSIRPLIVLIPDGEDPDSFLRKGSRAQLSDLLQEPLDLIEFYKKVYGDISRIDILRELTGIISGIEDPLMRGEYIKALSEKADLKEDFLIEEIKRLRNRQASDRGKNKADSSNVPGKNKITVPEELLLAVLLQYPEKGGIIIESLKPDDIEEPELRRLYAFIVNNYQVDPSSFKDGSFIHRIINTSEEDDPSINGLIANLALNIQIDEEGVDRVISDCLKQIRIRSIDRLIKEARSRNDLLLLNSLIKEKTKIQKTAIII